MALPVSALAAAFPEISSDRKYWMVRTQGGNYYQHYIDGGYVAIGYNYVTLKDLSGPIGTVFKRVKAKIQEQDPKNKVPGLGANQLIKFKDEMAAGDIVLIPSYDSDVIAFGIIQSSRVQLKSDSDEWQSDECPLPQT